MSASSTGIRTATADDTIIKTVITTLSSLQILLMPLPVYDASIVNP